MNSNLQDVWLCVADRDDGITEPGIRDPCRSGQDDGLTTGMRSWQVPVMFKGIRGIRDNLTVSHTACIYLTGDMNESWKDQSKMS